MRIPWRMLLAAGLLCFAAPLQAQVIDPTKSREQLDSLRRERDRLEAAQKKIQGQVTDAGALLRNLAQQRDAQNRVVNLIEKQISGLNSQLERSAAELALAQDNLTERKAVLNRRLADIYKRGPLRTFQVLLAAESFGDLVARYKYLYLTSEQDRALVHDVEKLTTRVSSDRGVILGTQNELTRKRLDHQAEMEHYADLADEQNAKIKSYNKNIQQLGTKISAVEKSEAALKDVLDRIDRDLKASAGKAGVDAPIPAGRLTTADLGALEWPVEGEVIRRFGLDTLKGGGVVSNHGIAIAAAAGTPVKAIGAGKVASVQTFGIWGLSVILMHGDTHLSLYMRLQSAMVKVGQTISKGQVIGTVGGANSDLGVSHLWFEIRGQNQIALDPITWLRARKP